MLVIRLSFLTKGLLQMLTDLVEIVTLSLGIVRSAYFRLLFGNCARKNHALLKIQDLSAYVTRFYQKIKDCSRTESLYIEFSWNHFSNLVIVMAIVLNYNFWKSYYQVTFLLLYSLYPAKPEVTITSTLYALRYPLATHVTFTVLSCWCSRMACVGWMFG